MGTVLSLLGDESGSVYLHNFIALPESTLILVAVLVLRPVHSSGPSEGCVPWIKHFQKCRSMFLWVFF